MLFTPQEALEWLESLVSQSPDNDDKYKTLKSIFWTTESVVRDDREALIGALKLWLERGMDPFLPLVIAAHHKLIELKPTLEAVDIEALPDSSATPYSSKEDWRRLFIEVKRMARR
jgi:hypothetical protein